MPSVFISYCHDPADPTHAERVAGLAASLLEGGLEVFFDQNRGDEEEEVPWPIWMEDKIIEADHVLLVCTELYLKKVRQEVADDEGQGVCWEAGIIYILLYRAKRNTTKFSPVVFSPADRRFIPTPLQGKQYFTIDSQSGYDRLYAFITDQYRILFPKQGTALQTIAQKTIKPLFAPPAEAATQAKTESVPASDESPKLTLKPDTPPALRKDIRGLDWYDECDAGHFIGRDDDVNQILGKLLSHPIIRLVGPSGVGKSSLIRAGLLPKIREFGWRACVIRPFENPAQRVPPQLTAQLLTSPGAFTTPFDPVEFRADVSELLSNNGIKRLVLFLDQFEDIVSPIAGPAAVDAMREFLRELWEQKEIKPYLRAVVVYRTDADARLGRLWQEVSGRPEGLPYWALEGLSCSAAENIINQTAREQGWQLETSVRDIVRQLALESQKLDCSGDVFPAYLQIFLKRVGFIPTDYIASLIGKYLEETLGRLKARGGEWQQCGFVLESLSLTTGAKATQSLNDLVRDTGVSRAVLAEMLPVLISERLVRPIVHEMYEIQHDRLAAAVIESMKDSANYSQQPDPSSQTTKTEPRKVFVSYAWGDTSRNASEEDRQRQEVVERLCRTLKKENWQVVRDESALDYGDLISTFMQTLGQANLVIVILSAKYLQSHYCMKELHALYQNSRQEKREFLDRIIPLVLDDARFGTPRERVECAKYWEAEYLNLKAELDCLSDEDFALYRRMKDWYNHVGNMLTYVNDVLHPDGFENIVKDDFAALRHMLKRHR